MYLKVSDITNAQRTSLKEQPPPPPNDGGDLFELIDGDDSDMFSSDISPTTSSKVSPVKHNNVKTNVMYPSPSQNTSHTEREKMSRTKLSLLLLGVLLLVFVAFDLWSTTFISLFEGWSNTTPDWKFYCAIAVVFSILVLLLIWTLDLPIRDLLSPP